MEEEIKDQITKNKEIQMKRFITLILICAISFSTAACSSVSGEKTPIHLYRFLTEAHTDTVRFSGLDLAEFLKGVEKDIVDGSDPYTVTKEALEQYFYENFSEQSTVEYSDSFSLICKVYTDEVVEFAYDDAVKTQGDAVLAMEFELIPEFGDDFTSYTDIKIGFKGALDGSLNEIHIFGNEVKDRSKTQVLPTNEELLELGNEYLSKSY